MWMPDTNAKNLENTKQNETQKKHSFFWWEINAKTKDLLDFRYNTQEEIDKLNDEMTTAGDLDEIIQQTNSNENNENINDENEEILKGDEGQPESHLEWDLQSIDEPENDDINDYKQEEPIEWEVIDNPDKEDIDENDDKEKEDMEENTYNETDNITIENNFKEDDDNSEENENKWEEDELGNSVKFFDPFELGFDEDEENNEEESESTNDMFDPFGLNEDKTDEKDGVENDIEEEDMDKENMDEEEIITTENDNEINEADTIEEEIYNDENSETDEEINEENDEVEPVIGTENNEWEIEENDEELKENEDETDNEIEEDIDEEVNEDNNNEEQIIDMEDIDEETDENSNDEINEENNDEGSKISDEEYDDENQIIGNDDEEFDEEEQIIDTENNWWEDEEDNEIDKEIEEDDEELEDDEDNIVINTPISVNPNQKDKKEEIKNKKIKKNSATWEVITDEEIQLEQWQDMPDTENDEEYQPSDEEIFEQEPEFFWDDELSQQFMRLVQNVREIFKLERRDWEQNPYFKILWWKTEDSTLEYLFYLIEEENEPVDLYIKKVETNKENWEENEHLVQFSYNENKELNIFVDEVILYEKINKSDPEIVEYNDTKAILEKFIFLTDNHYDKLKSELDKIYEEKKKKRQLQQIFKGF